MFTPNFLKLYPQNFHTPKKMETTPKSWDHVPQLNGTTVQKVEKAPNKIETAPKRFSHPKKRKMPPN
jgi:hypothetical protein